MNSKQHLFIYNRKEMGILVLLGVTVAVFAFTLGVHLGKRVDAQGALTAQTEPNLAATQPDQIPNAQEFKEQSGKAQQAAEESLNQALHDEVARTGLRMETPRQVDLPENAKTKEAGATATTNEPEASSVSGASAETVESTGARGKFALQIGSHPKIEDAKNQIVLVESAGLKAYLRAADVKGIGLRYRVFLGGYGSKDEAEKAGEKFKSQHLVDSFIVSKLSN